MHAASRHGTPSLTSLPKDGLRGGIKVILVLGQNFSTNKLLL